MKNGVTEIVYCFPNTDENSSSGISSQEGITVTNTVEELKEIREKCEDLQEVLRQEVEEDVTSLSICQERIQNLLDRTGSNIRDMMDTARNVFKFDRNKLQAEVGNREIVDTSVKVLNDVMANTQFYLDHLSISMSKVLIETLEKVEKEYASFDIVQDLLEKLDVKQSQNRANLLEAAQRKVIILN